MLRIELCGVLQERLGTDAVTIAVPVPTRVSDALAEVARRFPAIADDLPRTACAVGDAMVGRDDEVDGSAPLVLLPPVSGG